MLRCSFENQEGLKPKWVCRLIKKSSIRLWNLFTPFTNLSVKCGPLAVEILVQVDVPGVSPFVFLRSRRHCPERHRRFRHHQTNRRHARPSRPSTISYCATTRAPLTSKKTFSGRPGDKTSWAGPYCLHGHTNHMSSESTLSHMACRTQDLKTERELAKQVKPCA